MNHREDGEQKAARLLPALANFFEILASAGGWTVLGRQEFIRPK